MSKPTVYAVMRCTIEIPVQPSSADETFEQMHKAALREAEGIVRRLSGEERKFRLVGQVEFSHAVVRAE